MKVLPFGKYQPNPRRGEVSAREHHFTDVTGETFTSYAVLHMSWSGDRANIDRGYATMVDAGAAACQQAKRRNTVFIPSNEG